MEDIAQQVEAHRANAMGRKKVFQYIDERIEEVVCRLARAAEYKEEDTWHHLRRMSLYSAALARQMKLESDFVQEIYYAAPLHDVGKVAIPDRILLKPTKLIDSEWEIMQEHTTLGKRILEDSNYSVLRLGAVIAYTHHERWDGTGYPRGLSGEDIPIAGRIVALVDVFDNLTSKRPYKEPFSLEETFELLRDAEGSQFDPVATEAFFKIEAEIIEIRERNEDRGETIFLQMPGRSRMPDTLVQDHSA